MKPVLKSNLFCLGILLGISFVLIYLTDRYILTLNFFDNSGEYLSGIPEREGEVYAALQKYIYISAAVYLAFKLILISLIIYTALYIAGQQIKFSRALNIVIWSEYLFLLPAILKIIWFKTGYPNGTLSDWHKCYILSSLSLVGNVAAAWNYPLQTLNLFEIAYWCILAYGIFKATSLDYDQSLRIVVSSYVPALFIWVVIVVFCTVMMFPGTV
jgi:hypothetical protein